MMKARRCLNGYWFGYFDFDLKRRGSRYPNHGEKRFTLINLG